MVLGIGKFSRIAASALIGLASLSALADEPLRICGTPEASVARPGALDPTAAIYASIDDLFNFHFVDSNSEYVSAARGSFEHFEYNRVIGNQLGKQGYLPCVSLVKTGARDFGNGNIYSDYFVQAAFGNPGAAEPDYILSSLYLAGSVQSLEGTLAQKPWYMMDAKKVNSTLQSLAAKAAFSPVANPATPFNPVTIVKNAGLVADRGAEVYDGSGVTYTPIYGSGGTLFLVTWGMTLTGPRTPNAEGALVKRTADGAVSVAQVGSVNDQIVVPLDQIRGDSYPQKAGEPDPTDQQLQDAVLSLSKL